MKIEVFSSEGQPWIWYWHMKASNGKILWSGETHTSYQKTGDGKSAALRAARRCNSLLAEPVKIYVNGEFLE